MARIAPMILKIPTHTAPGELLNQTNYKTGLLKIYGQQKANKKNQSDARHASSFYRLAKASVRHVATNSKKPPKEPLDSSIKDSELEAQLILPARPIISGSRCC